MWFPDRNRKYYFFLLEKQLLNRARTYRDHSVDECDPPPQPHCKGFCSGIYQPLCSFVFLTGEKRSCQCTQGNMANLQKYKASKKDRSCKSKKTSTKILASYSPVSTISHSLPSCLGSSGSQCSHSREKNKTEKKRCHVRARKTLFGILVIPQMKS